jgi:hypothetical protein
LVFLKNRMEANVRAGSWLMVEEVFEYDDPASTSIFEPSTPILVESSRQTSPLSIVEGKHEQAPQVGGVPHAVGMLCRRLPSGSHACTGAHWPSATAFRRSLCR